MPAQRLDDDLLGVQDVVDDQPEPLLFGVHVQDHDESAAFAVHLQVGVRRAERDQTELLVQAHQGQHMSRSR